MLALAHAWHRRCLDDPVVSHPFSHGELHPAHVERLAAYWSEALGGPSVYTDTMGDHVDVMRMHAGNGPHPDLDARAIELFVLAMADVGIPEQARPALAAYFREMITRMSRYPASPEDVPADVAFPHWSWDGPLE